MPRKPLPVGTWGSVSRREVSPGRWRAATRFRDFDGRTRQVEAWGRSGAQAEAALRRSLIDRAAPSCDDVTPDTRLDRLGTIWFEEIEASGRLAAQTLDIYRRILEGTVLPAVGGLRVREATTGRVDRFLKALASTPAKARLARVVLGGLLGVAVRHDALSTNPVRGAARLPGARRRPRALSLDELGALRDGVRKWQADPHQRGPKRAPDLLDVVDLLLATGARVGEVLAIRWSDVDLSAERPTLTVTGTVIQVRGEGLRRQDHPKTASGRRTIVLPRFAVDTLMRLRLAADGNPHDVVFPSSVGTLRSPNNFRRQWRSARAACGFEWVTPHTYRKTVATLLDRERGTKDAAAQLGHSGTAVTERHYVERAAVAPDASDVLEALADASRAPNARESGG